MKIPLKAVTVTYTRTLTLAPTTEMFEDYEYYPDQEDFESLVINQLFDKIHNEMGGPANPMPYTNVEQFETVEIDWEGDEEEDEEMTYEVQTWDDADKTVYYETVKDAIDYESARDIIVEKYPNRKVIAVIRK